MLAWRGILSIWLQPGWQANADARIAAVHAMNAGERIQINAIVPISTDGDNIDELRFVGFPAGTDELEGCV
ncbi:MAG: hypothetical protein Q7J47_14740 [Azoarcus sp.]|jgi:hypothetical protein|nr:hypothetical protein [Azoarcus sp.]